MSATQSRTLADLITDEPSELTTLPWVNHRSRRWEPEPLRWLGINTMVNLPVSDTLAVRVQGARLQPQLPARRLTAW